MAYVMEIIQYKSTARLPGQRTTERVLGAGVDTSATKQVKKTQVTAAGLSAALDDDTRMVEVANLTGSQLAYVRVNATAAHPTAGGADTTNASASEASSITLMVGERIRFQLPYTGKGSYYKIDIR